jgi:hypothetical protein
VHDPNARPVTQADCEARYGRRGAIVLSHVTCYRRDLRPGDRLLVQHYAQTPNGDWFIVVSKPGYFHPWSIAVWLHEVRSPLAAVLAPHRAQRPT